MLAGDHKNTVLSELSGGVANAIGYTAYGHASGEQPVKTQLGFNGEFGEPNTGWQLLGNGYRAYNLRLMRFHSPDSWSPFGDGGVNAYAYCEGDPVTYTDPAGHGKLGNILRAFRTTTKTVSKGVPEELLKNTKANGSAASVFPITLEDVKQLEKNVILTKRNMENPVFAAQKLVASSKRGAKKVLEAAVEQHDNLLPAYNSLVDALRFADKNIGKPGITRESRSIFKKGADIYDARMTRALNDLKNKAREVRGPKIKKSYLGDGNS